MLVTKLVEEMEHNQDISFLSEVESIIRRRNERKIRTPQWFALGANYKIGYLAETNWLAKTYI